MHQTLPLEPTDNVKIHHEYTDINEPVPDNHLEMSKSQIFENFKNILLNHYLPNKKSIKRCH